MTKKKSIAVEAKTKHNAYKRSKINKRAKHFWRVSFFIMKAVRIFLRYKRSFVTPGIVDLDNDDFNRKILDESCIDLANIPTESKCRAKVKLIMILKNPKIMESYLKKWFQK